MTKTVNIKIKHLTRVEGHGNISIRVEKGELKEAKWQIVETPRYFEVMLRGKHFSLAAAMTARICGICSISHSLASIRATERAFQIEVPEGVRKLRLLAKHAETLQSHILHLFFLAAPDFAGLPSALPLIERNPEIIEVGKRLKGLANRLSDLVAGRTTHPVSLRVGGMSVIPEKKALASFRDELTRSFKDLEYTVKLFQSFEIPEFARETEFVSLKPEEGYPFIGGRLISSDGVEKGEDECDAMTNEFVDEDNTSKLCRLSRDSFAVGALARVNNNYAFLDPAARNPFMNNLAQLVESVHVVHDSIRLIDELTDNLPPPGVPTPVKPRAGEGVGAVEAPRGLLYHHYVYDAEGSIVSADCIIPTTQNNLNIQHDLRELVKSFAPAMKDKELELLSSMLVRAYDPCISCSVH
jgi:coenzyme F420-reducing hydrogenase alpha subunit